MMTKYKKKPVVIDAVKFTGDNELEVCRFLQKCSASIELATFDKSGIQLKTLEGTMTASPGDYVIVGIKKEVYPCKPDIFEATYSPAEEGEEKDLQVEEVQLCQLVRQMEAEATARNVSFILKVIPSPNHPKDPIRWVVERLEKRTSYWMGPATRTLKEVLEQAFTKGEAKK